MACLESLAKSLQQPPAFKVPNLRAFFHRTILLPPGKVNRSAVFLFVFLL